MNFDAAPVGQSGKVEKTSRELLIERIAEVKKNIKANNDYLNQWAGNPNKVNTLHTAWLALDTYEQELKKLEEQLKQEEA